jgi:Uma2 family endonuclease
MSLRVHAPATYEDLLKVPDHLVAELIDGELFTSPRPGVPHAEGASELLSILRTAFGKRGDGSWHILFEPELHLGGDVLVPDLAGWRTDHLPALPRTPSISIAPDWACEFLSTNQRLDRAVKMPIYAREGVPYAWLIDVNAQYLEVKRLANGFWTELAVFSGEAKVRAEPFEAIEIDMTLVWGPPPA